MVPLLLQPTKTLIHSWLGGGSQKQQMGETEATEISKNDCP